MSSTDALFAMRYSGSSRASAAFAGSSEGNGLSVTAISRRGMTLSLSRRSTFEHLRIDDIGRPAALQQRQNIVDHDIRHLLAYLGHRTAKMRRGDDVWHLQQRLRYFGLVLEDVEAGAGDLPLFQRAHQRSLVHDRATRRVDEECRRLHQRQLARGDLMAGLGPQRRVN